ncbi:lipopolysaccharide transport periplasmic protein LptA [Marinospirillum sp.]|uniref:lipopolysaccharide transport periplasmic protein LptA n=1 Tax=Marinospirillum sp. TaxID=2183934 RepID=UPI003A895952
MSPFATRCAWMLSLSLIASQALALPEDREAPIRVQAQQMDWQQQTQTATYRGDVEVTQGELKIEASELRLIRGAQGELQQAIAQGQTPLAYMRDLPQLDQPIVEAWAEVIDYHPASETLTLTGRARLIQGEDEFQGHRLVYHLTTQDLQAEQAPESSPASRVEIILTPQRRENP